MVLVRNPFIAALGIGVLVCASAHAAPAAQPGLDHADRTHKIVSITPDSLHPRVMRFGAEYAFGWLNYTSSSLRISFDAAVARKLVCESRSKFHVSAGRFMSQEISESRFISLCRLARGEYAYRVELLTNESGGDSQAVRVLRGILIVN